MNRTSIQTLGGIVGPVAFIAAWASLGAGQPGYSPIEDPISRLAAAGSPTRPGMTAGLLAFGVGVGLYSLQLRRFARAPAVAAAVTAAATVAVAALPLDARYGDTPHAIAAAVAYAGLAGVPLTAARAMSRRGNLTQAALSAATGLAVGALLTASVVLPGSSRGLAQRAGLTAGDVWIVVSAAAGLGRRR